MLRDVAAQQRVQFNNYVGNCINGHRTRKSESVGVRRETHPGMTLRATDREYVVQENGSWLRGGDDSPLNGRAFVLPELPREKSQIFVPHGLGKSRLSGKAASRV